MRIGLMQPYFVPYIGYFSLIEYADKFIFFDTAQYISRGWVNRNRVQKQNGSPDYITIPVKKAPQKTQIKDIEIADSEKWREAILGKLTVYKRKAPNYEPVMDFIHDILYESEYDNLSELNCSSIVKTCEFIGLKGNFGILSEMDLQIGQVQAPDEWALYITKALQGDIYVNPPGGQSFYDKEKFRSKNIKLQFLKSGLKPYLQKTEQFEPGLSIIDVMMFCKNDEIKAMLTDYRIIE